MFQLAIFKVAGELGATCEHAARARAETTETRAIFMRGLVHHHRRADESAMRRAQYDFPIAHPALAPS